MIQLGAAQTLARNAAALIFIVIVQMAAATTTNVVTSSADDGVGTLRQTILDATPGDVITFATNLSGATILLTSGQLELDKDLTIDASSLPGGIQIDGNASGRIFRVFNSQTVVLTSLTITNGVSANGDGGGIHNSGNLTVTKCRITRCKAGSPYSGGGICNNGQSGGRLTVNQSTIEGNSAPFGGGIANLPHGILTVNQSTLVSNYTSSAGGGIYSDSTLTVNQSTLIGNTAINQGGGIDCALSRSNSFNLNQSTIVGNSAYFGGGLKIQLGDPESWNSLTNSIVAGNDGTWGADISYEASDPFLVGGVNIVQNFFDEDNNTTNGLIAIQAAPQLSPLGNYGGPTQTMPPLSGSPAIDAGGDFVTNNFATDQRGFPRLYGAHVDIGAVELQVQVIVATNPPVLTGLTILSNGAFGFNFTNLTGAGFTVFASTNFSLPLNSWANLGPAIETPTSSGQYQFIDPQTTNNPQRFYRVRSP